MSRPVIHVLYENPAWLAPLLAALDGEGLAHREHEVWRGVVDAGRVPEEGIYLNRMSPSAHTRGHDESCDLMAEMLTWLENHGRRVVNGSRSFTIEVSKLQQDLALRRHGILTPRTILCVGREAMVAAARAFEGPFLTKHNCGGKGLGVQLFESAEQLAARIETIDVGPRGQVVLQEYVKPREPFVTRVEIVGGRFVYALRSDTSKGFELCPADACQVPAAAPDVCPADGGAKFALSPIGADDPLVCSYLALCAAEGIEIAGIEFVEGADGRRYTYDINCNTNFSSTVDRLAGVEGMKQVAKYLATLANDHIGSMR
jgi:hypothetical protein